MHDCDKATCRANHSKLDKPFTQKYSAFVLAQIIGITPPVSRRMRGVGHRHERGEMRWTRELRLTCAAQAYGEVVWFGRRGAGVKLARGFSLTTEAKEPFSGESTKQAVKPLRREGRDAPAALYARVHLLPKRKRHTGPRVQHAPGLPCALLFRGRKVPTNLGRFRSRECEAVSTRHCERSEAIHCHLVHGKMDCFAALAMTWMGRSS